MGIESGFQLAVLKDIIFSENYGRSANGSTEFSDYYFLDSSNLLNSFSRVLLNFNGREWGT